MINLLIRFIFVYFFMSFSMKLMGKRQVGQLQMSELVTAFFLSELATFSVTDPNIPLLYGLIPILVMICIEVIVSFLSVKIRCMKKLFDFVPSVLIFNGQVQKNELLKNRITLEELFSQLRLCGEFDITKIKCAVLEPNGQLSVLPYGAELPVTRGDMNILSKEEYSLAVVVDGTFNEGAGKAIGKDRKWVENALKKKKIKMSEVFLAVCNENEIIQIIRKETK